MTPMTTSAAAHPPRIALAMLNGLAPGAFAPQHWDRLRAIGTIIEAEPLTEFTSERAERVLGAADVLLGHWGCPPLTADALARAPALRLFVYAAGTVKWQVTDAVWERGIVVTSAAAANAVPVAEYTLAAILFANKGVFLFREQLRDRDRPFGLDRFTPGNVAKVVGIVGASHVGRLVIDHLRAFALDVVVFDPYLEEPAAAALGVQIERDLDALCARVDVLSLHAPDIPATRGMIGAAQLARLRDGAVVINTARPALVDQDALVAELRTGRISAVLDVTTPEPLPPDHELLTLPNAFVTPHIAGSLGTELHRMADLAVAEIERFARGEPARHPVRRADLDRIA
jgi:phosphoglycerate dehydrogenase-like enzyme